MKARPPIVLSLAIACLLQVMNCPAQETKDEQPPLIKARSLYRTGKLDEAMVAYQAIVASDPKSAGAYAGLARVLIRKQKIAEALDAARKAVEIDSKSVDAHVALGEVYFREALMAESELEFVEALKIDISTARALLGRAKIFRAESFYKRAHDFIVRAHELDPSDPDIQRAWLSTLKPEEEADALEGYLAGQHDDEADDRTNMAAYLILLRERLKEPDKKCKLVTKPDRTKIQMDRLLDGPNRYLGVGLKIGVNGKKTTLMVDTGASGIVLTPKFAERAGIQSIVHATVSGVGDKGPAGEYLGRADSIKIGDLEFQNCVVEVTEKKSTLDVEGLIGADMFDHYLVTIDIPGLKLDLAPLPKRPDSAKPSTDPEAEILETDSVTNESHPHDRYIDPSMSGFSSVYRFGHILLIPTSIQGTTTKLFLIDTGAFTTLISPAAAREVTQVGKDSTMRVKGVSGEVENVYRADHARIAFSHYRQENQGIVSFDMSRLSKDFGTEVSGALGFTLLNMMRIVIDYRDGLVDFQYVPTPRDPHY